MATYSLKTYEIRAKGAADLLWVAQIQNESGMVLARSEEQPTEQAAVADLKAKAAIVGFEVS